MRMPDLHALAVARGNDQTTTDSGRSESTRYRYVVAASLCVVYTCNFLDRQFLAILAEPVKHSLHLTDTQLGLLTGLMFALFYTIFGIPVAALADRYNRVRIVALACGLWSFCSAACGFAAGFASLAIARMGVGVGEAGGAAPSYSIISDYFPPEKRGVGLAIFSLGVPFGTMLGAASGGWIAAHYGWRMAFFVLGGAGVLLAPLIPLIVREPARGRLDVSRSAPGSTAPAASVFTAIKVFVRTPTLVLTACAAGLTAVIIYGLLSWMPAYLIREEGMSLSQIATSYSLVAGATIGIGTLVGGYLVDKVAPRRPALYALLPGTFVLLGLPFLFGVTAARSGPMALLFMAGPYILANTYLAPALTVIQNSVAPSQRSAAGAIFLFVLNIIGLGCGPLLIGIASDWFAPTYGVHALRMALLCLAPVFVLVFLVQLAAAWTLKTALPGVSGATDTPPVPPPATGQK
jgi:predicted MFS family arabinose efflux permease